MDARLYAPGEEVFVVLRRRNHKRVSYQGIVVQGRAPERFLHISCGGRLFDIPWGTIRAINPLERR